MSDEVFRPLVRGGDVLGLDLSTKMREAQYVAWGEDGFLRETTKPDNQWWDWWGMGSRTGLYKHSRGMGLGLTFAYSVAYDDALQKAMGLDREHTFSEERENLSGTQLSRWQQRLGEGLYGVDWDTPGGEDAEFMRRQRDEPGAYTQEVLGTDDRQFMLAAMNPEDMEILNATKSKLSWHTEMNMIQGRLYFEQQVKEADRVALNPVSGRTMSALFNYIGGDPSLIPSVVIGVGVGTGVSKAAQGVNIGWKSMAALQGAAGAIEGGSWGTAYALTDQQLRSSFGIAEPEFDITPVIFGTALGGLLGAAGGALFKNAPDEIRNALIEETAGGPLAPPRVVPENPTTVTVDGTSVTATATTGTVDGPGGRTTVTVTKPAKKARPDYEISARKRAKTRKQQRETEVSQAKSEAEAIVKATTESQKTASLILNKLREAGLDPEQFMWVLNPKNWSKVDPGLLGRKVETLDDIAELLELGYSSGLPRWIDDLRVAGLTDSPVAAPKTGPPTVKGPSAPKGTAPKSHAEVGGTAGQQMAGAKPRYSQSSETTFGDDVDKSIYAGGGKSEPTTESHRLHREYVMEQLGITNEQFVALRRSLLKEHRKFYKRGAPMRFSRDNTDNLDEILGKTTKATEPTTPTPRPVAEAAEPAAAPEPPPLVRSEADADQQMQDIALSAEMDQVEGMADIERRASVLTSLGRKLGPSARGVIKSLDITPGKTLTKGAVRLGEFMTRGAGTGDAVGVGAVLIQSINRKGIRLGDRLSAFTGRATLQSAQQAAQRRVRIGPHGIQKILLKHKSDLRKMILQGDNPMQMMARRIRTGTSTGLDWLDEICDRWKKLNNELGDEAVAAGLISKKEKDYFPVMWSNQKITNGADEFMEALTDYFVRKYKDPDAALSMVTAQRCGWGKMEGKRFVWGTSKGNPDLPIDGSTKFRDLAPAEKRIYLEKLQETMKQEATNTRHRLARGENVGRFLDGDDHGKILGRNRNSPDSRQHRKFSSDIALDERLGAFIEPDIDKYILRMESSTFAEIEFALGQKRVFGEALTWDDMVEAARHVQKGLPDAEASALDRMIVTADEIWNREVGRPTDKQFGREINGVLDEIVYDVGAGLARTAFGIEWGISVLTMEMPLAVMRVLNTDPRVTAQSMADAFRSIRKHDYRWEMLASIGDAGQEVSGSIRYGLSLPEHEGNVAGYTFGSKLRAPWLEVPEAWNNSKLLGMWRILTSGVQTASDVAITFGGMPTLTRAGRVMVARTEERLLARRANAMVSLGEALDGGSTEKAFRGLVRDSGLGGEHIAAAQMNGSGLLDPKTTAFIKEAAEAGHITSRDGVDHDALVRWARSNGKMEGYKYFAIAMQDYVSSRVNLAFSAPTALSRIHADNSFVKAMTLFMQFPASYYQNVLLVRASDDSFRGLAAVGLYIGAESIHRATRDALPWNGSPKDHMDKWEKDPQKMFFQTLTGGIPMTGIRPIGATADQTIRWVRGKGFDLSNIVDTSTGASGAARKIGRLSGGAVDYLMDREASVQAGTEWGRIFDLSNSIPNRIIE